MMGRGRQGVEQNDGQDRKIIFVKVAKTKFKDIQGPGRKNLSFSRTFKDFKDIFKNSRISRFFKDRGNHAWVVQFMTKALI